MGDRKIPTSTAVFMVVIAAAIDLFNMALDFVSFGLLSWLVDFVALIVFSLWFSSHEASLWERNPGLTLATTVVDAVPFGDLTFPWTWRVAYGAFTERNEISASNIDMTPQYRMPADYQYPIPANGDEDEMQEAA